MMKNIAVFLTGLLFSAGLMVSGMSDPENVIAFLDITGNWDPSLAFVIGGAVVVTFIGYKFVLGRVEPIFGESFNLPTAKNIDLNLILGAAIFGLGWGLTGLCPGPALAVLAVKPVTVAVFLLAMLGGIRMGGVVTGKATNGNVLAYVLACPQVIVAGTPAALVRVQKEFERKWHKGQSKTDATRCGCPEVKPAIAADK